METGPGHRPGARDRRALAGVVAQFFVNGLVTASYVARLPELRDRVGVGVDGFGLLLTAAAAAGLVASLLVGRVLERTSTRRLLQLGAVVLVLAVPAIGAATSPLLLLLALSVFTATDTMVDIAMNLQGSWLSARRRTPVMNRLHGVWSLGLFTGGAGAAVAGGLGVGPPVHLAVVAAVAGAVLLVATRAVLPTDEDTHDDAVAPGPAVPATAPRAGATAVVLLALAGAFAVLLEIASADWAAFRMADDLGTSAGVASLAFAAYAVGMTGMRLAGDSLVARFGRGPVHRTALVVVGAGVLVATTVPRPAVAVLGFLLAGVGVATMMPRLYDDAARLPGRRGAGLGAMTAGMRVAFLLTPATVGALAGSGLGVGTAIAVVALPAVVALAVVTSVTDRVVRPG